MNQLEHEWVTFYSPRNGRLSIQACNICGVAKGMITGAHKCKVVSIEQKHNRLKGWTTDASSKSSHSVAMATNRAG